MTIQVIMTTYCPEPGHPRGRYAVQCANGLRNFLLSTHEDIAFIIANDGPRDQPHIGAIWDELGDCQVQVAAGPRAGIGGSLNRALKLVGPDDLWLYTTDDWDLVEEYPLGQGVRLIRDNAYHYVRLGPPHPNIHAQIKFQEKLGWWLHLQTYSGFVFATRPFLATRTFYEGIGPFKEDCDSYACERDYADRVNNNPSANNVMAEVVCGSLEGPWQHIGEVNVGERYP